MQIPCVYCAEVLTYLLFSDLMDGFFSGGGLGQIFISISDPDPAHLKSNWIVCGSRTKVSLTPLDRYIVQAEH